MAAGRGPGARLRRALVGALGLPVALGLAGCNTLVAQSGWTAMKPVNAVRWSDEPRLMLGGRDVVAYFADGASVQGDPRLRADFEDVSFHFRDTSHQRLFMANPRAYVPAYHGFCAASMLNAVPRPADPAVFVVLDGRLFLFADAPSKALFLSQQAEHIARADRYWREQVDGQGVLWQRLKRWAVPVADPVWPEAAALAS